MCSVDADIGCLAGGNIRVFPSCCRVSDGVCRFSLSDENEAAGDGEWDWIVLLARLIINRVDSEDSPSSGSTVESLADRAMADVEKSVPMRSDTSKGGLK